MLASEAGTSGNTEPLGQATFSFLIGLRQKEPFTFFVEPAGRAVRSLVPGSFIGTPSSIGARSNAAACSTVREPGPPRARVGRARHEGLSQFRTSRASRSRRYGPPRG